MTMKEERIKLYTQISGKPMNVIAFASTSGTNVQALFNHQKEYIIRAVFVDKLCGAKKRAEEKLKLPVIYDSAYKFVRQNYSDAVAKDEVQAYLKKSNKWEEHCTRRIIKYAQDNNFTVDFLFLAGYMRIVNDTFLQWFPDKIANVHPARLDVLYEDGTRKYDGDNAVLKAIVAGEEATYSTVHLVTSTLDGGEILCTSEPCVVDMPSDIGEIVKVQSNIIRKGINIDDLLMGLRVNHSTVYRDLVEFAGDHQDKQKEMCDWPTYTKAAQMIAEGRFEISLERNEFNLRDVYLEGEKMPYCGFELGGEK